MAARTSSAKTLAGALLVETVGGLFYAFGLYSETLKRVYHLSQGQVQLIGTAANIGGNVGIHAGVFYDRYGPKATVGVALLLGGVGWGGLWLVLVTRWAAPVGVLVVLGFLQGHAQMVSDCAVVPTIARTFPPEQFAMALGLAKSLVGLSGSLAAQMYVGLFPASPHSASTADDVDRRVIGFLQVVALWFCGSCAVGLVTLELPPSKGARDALLTARPHALRALDLLASDRWLLGGYGLVLALVAVLVSSSLAQASHDGGGGSGGGGSGTSGGGALSSQQLFSAGAFAILGLLVVHIALGPSRWRNVSTWRSGKAAAAAECGDAVGEEERQAGRRDNTVPALATSPLLVGEGSAQSEQLPLGANVSHSVAPLEWQPRSQTEAQSEHSPTEVVPALVMAEALPQLDDDDDAAALRSTEGGNSCGGGGGQGVVVAQLLEDFPPPLASIGSSPPPPPPAPGLSLSEALMGLTFWLHVCMHFCMASSAFFVINNVAQLARTLEAEATAHASAVRLVSLLSACNCLGRLGAAAASEAASRLGLPRTAPFVPATALMALAMACVASGERAALAPACALTGLAFGALNALNAVVVSSLYGLRSFGAIYTAVVIAGALGSAGVASGLAVWVYDAHLKPGETVCEGAACFRLTASVCVCLNVLGCGCAIALSVRLHAANLRSAKGLLG